MKLQIALAMTTAVFAVCADTQPDAVSDAVVYSLDTYPQPRVLKTQADVAKLWDAAYKVGETVTCTSPDGVTSTLVDNPALNGFVPLGINAGGIWTFSNAVEGEATFAVRHSVYGTLGNGTPDSPFNVVDTMELFELILAGKAKIGSVYRYVGLNGDMPTMPPGFLKESVSDGLWIIAEDPNVVASLDYIYSLDTLFGGPDRTIDTWRGCSIAYSGDEWAFDANAASTVSVSMPGGGAQSYDLTGTGAIMFKPKVAGDYLVTMTAGDRTLTSVITYIPKSGFNVLVR